MRVLAAFLLGFLLLGAAGFVLFVGLWNGYFTRYGINEYFNLIYITSMPWLVFALSALPVGWALLYAPFRTFFRGIYALLLCVLAISWYAPVADEIGFWLFSSKAKLPSPDASVVSREFGDSINIPSPKSATLLYRVKNSSYYLLENGTTKVIVW